MTDWQGILEEIKHDIQPLLGQGAVADYIPPLADVSPTRFGMAVRLIDGSEFAVGEADAPFSIQSVSKTFRLAKAMEVHGDALWKRVGREASGTAFNSLLQLEADRGIPRNPMISAGALVAMDAIMGGGQVSCGAPAPVRLMGPGMAEVTGAFDSGTPTPENDNPGIDFVSQCLDGAPVSFDAVVADAELATTHRNRALAHLLKAFGNLNHDPEDVVAAHTRESAITLSCRELCRASTYLATGGLTVGGSRVLDARQVKRLNAVMLTCGVYDEAGDYAYRVGLPAKSGVGGGVVAVMPGQFTVAVWSPALNTKGNSLAGTMALELFTTLTGVSIF